MLSSGVARLAALIGLARVQPEEPNPALTPELATLGCLQVNCSRSFSRIFGRPQSGYSRFKQSWLQSAPAADSPAGARGRLPIAEALALATLVAIEDFCSRSCAKSELGAQRRHLLALDQAGDEHGVARP